MKVTLAVLRFVLFSSKVAVVAAALFVSAALWWRAWMYLGWPGAPRLFAPLWRTDGEGGYDRVFVEMLTTLVIGAFALFGAQLGLAKSSRKKKTSA